MVKRCIPACFMILCQVQMYLAQYTIFVPFDQAAQFSGHLSRHTAWSGHTVKSVSQLLPLLGSI